MYDYVNQMEFPNLAAFVTNFLSFVFSHNSIT